MNTWKYILNTAILGTERQKLNLLELPKLISENLNEAKSDGETLLLNASTLYLYWKKATITYQTTDELFEGPIYEIKKTADSRLTNLFDEITLVNPHYFELLFSLWLDKLIDNNEIVPTQMILPILYEAKAASNHIKSKVIDVIGNSGLKILNHFPEYNNIAKLEISENWRNGNMESRKNNFLQLYKLNPNDCVALIKMDWSLESIQFKYFLLTTIVPTAIQEFDSFILNLYKDEFSFKANEKKTERECRRICIMQLVTNPNSEVRLHLTSLYNQYIKTENKTFLARLVSGKSKFNIEIPITPDSILNADNLLSQYGINPKNDNPQFYEYDTYYWINELLKITPLSILSELTSTDSMDVANYLLEEFYVNIGKTKYSVFESGLRENAKYFKNDELILLLCKRNPTVENIEMVNLLNKSEFESLTCNSNNQIEMNYFNYYNTSEGEWNLSFSLKVISAFYNSYKSNLQTANFDKKKIIPYIHYKSLDHLMQINEKTFRDYIHSDCRRDFFEPLKHVLTVKVKIKQL